MTTLSLQNSSGTTNKKYNLVFILCLALFCFSLIGLFSKATAQTVLFDFDNAPLGSSLPIDQSAGGITAHLAATGQGFSIQEANVLGFTSSGFSGRIIYANRNNPSDLLIGFDQIMTDFLIMYSPQELSCDNSATIKLEKVSHMLSVQMEIALLRSLQTVGSIIPRQ
jgi:hypothetical protein